MRALARTTAALTLPLLVVGLVGLGAPGASAAAGTAASDPATFGFTGGGWGHGVGMSQYGAFGMASEGASATTILTHYYSGTTIGAYRDDQDLAVNVAHRAGTVKFRTEALAPGGGGVTLVLGTTQVNGRAGDVFVVGVSGAKLAVTKNGTKVGTGTSVAIRWSGTRHPSSTPLDDSKATVLDLIGSNGSLTTAGHRYRYGTAKVVARASAGVTRLEAVNTLRLQDEYLRGIAEVPSAWPKAALQAQVIAARSYALVKYAQGVKGGCQCHVDSGHGPYYDQNFVGYVKESSAYGSAWRAAVTATISSATTARTLLYKGRPAQAFYSSSTGGRTQNAKDVWGTDVPYLRSVDDHWSAEKKYNPTFASWGPYSRTQKQVATAFALPDVARIDLTDRYVSGALRSVSAFSAAGTKATLSAGSFVVRLSLTSNWVRSLTPLSANVGASTGGTRTTATIRAYPLATAAGAKRRYYGYRVAHPTLAASRLVDGSGTSAAARKHKAEVTLIQNWLKQLGYLTATPNGHFGPATDKAVRAFQKRTKVRVDGLVGGGAGNKGGVWKSLQVQVNKR